MKASYHLVEMTRHTLPVALSGTDCLDVDVQVQVVSNFVGFTNAGPTNSGAKLPRVSQMTS